jgi:peptidyl-prolyl cis-trans isomerase B (cyclophilin B)
MADKKPTATIEMEQGGKIVIELDPLNAPNTVKNFIALANSGFYDGLTFHRVIPGFMIQGGCPEGFGTGDPGYKIKGEFKANGHENKLKHKRGVISMARAQPNDSAGCQFFIMDKDSTHLDGQYAAFGQAKEGLEVIDRIVSVATDPNDKPLEKQTIKSITVETYGVDYEPPEKL